MRMYDNGDELVQEMQEEWNKNLRSMRIWGIIAAILMIIIGVLCIFYPVQTTYAIEVMVAVALLVFGCWEIVRYTQRPIFLRTGASLASGILNIFLAIWLLTSPAIYMLMSFGFLFGLDLLMLGFEQMTMTGRLKSIGISGTGWMTASAVINIIIGIILLALPVASVATVSALLAVYLIFGGISLLILSINAKDLKA